MGDLLLNNTYLYNLMKADIVQIIKYNRFSFFFFLLKCIKYSYNSKCDNNFSELLSYNFGLLTFIFDCDSK